MPENRSQEGTPRLPTQPEVASEGPTPNTPPDKDAAPPQEERSFAGEDDMEGRIEPPRQEAADRMPEASRTRAAEGDEPGKKTSPTG